MTECNLRALISNNQVKKALKYCAPQGPVLGALLFILFINDLYKNVKFNTVHHFGDDTNMFFIEKLPKN